jgi:opacity protein-like surface antigen
MRRQGPAPYNDRMRLRALAALILTALPSAARSQTIEITPLVGYRFGGSLQAAPGTGGGSESGVELEVDDAAAFGVQLGYRVGEGEIELLYARQNTQLQTADIFTGAPVFELALETWQIGGTYLFGDDDARARPFVAVGLGLTRLLPNPSGLSDETRFSASFGAGVKLWLGHHFGIRLEGRGFFTVLDSDSRSFCDSDRGCLIRTTGSELSQAEARAGLILRF